MSFTVRIPVPPSTNALFVTWQERGGQARGKTKQYKAWATAAGWTINVARPTPIKGPVNIRLECPENGRRDLDNHLKAVMDLLVEMKLIESDRCKCVRTVELCWHEHGHGDALLAVWPAA